MAQEWAGLHDTFHGAQGTATNGSYGTTKHVTHGTTRLQTLTIVARNTLYSEPKAARI